jgi:hypothetical protein
LRLLFRMPRAVIRLLSEGNRGFGPPSGPRFDCTPPTPTSDAEPLRAQSLRGHEICNAG